MAWSLTEILKEKDRIPPRICVRGLRHEEKFQGDGQPPVTDRHSAAPVTRAL